MTRRLFRHLERDRAARAVEWLGPPDGAPPGWRPVALAPAFPGPPLADQLGEPQPVPGTDAIVPDMTREYVAERGLILSGLDGGFVLPRTVDDVTRQFGGDTVYELMNTDPACGASYTTLERAVFTGEFQVKPHPGNRMEPGADPATVTPEQARAAEIGDFAQRLMRGMEEPPEEVGRQMFKAVRLGAQAGEIVLDLGDEGGPDALRYIVKRIKVKPRRTWSFWVDAFNNVVGFLVNTPDGRRILPREKFLLWSWGVEDSDPRGTSIFRRAFQFWQLKLQTIPEYLNYLMRFATPFLIGVCAAISKDDATLDAQGHPLRGADRQRTTPEQRMTGMLQHLRGSMVGAVPNGAEVRVEESKSQGEPHRAAIELCDREMMLGILSETRAALEAKHSSKADSESAVDMLGMVIRTLKGQQARIWTWQVVYPLLVLNFGKADADAYCPEISLPAVEHQDIADLLRGLSLIAYQVAPSQLAYWDTQVGAPPRKPEETDLARQAAEVAAQPPPPPAPPGAPPFGGGGPPEKAPPKEKPTDKQQSRLLRLMARSAA